MEFSLNSPKSIDVKVLDLKAEPDNMDLLFDVVAHFLWMLVDSNEHGQV